MQAASCRLDQHRLVDRDASRGVRLNREFRQRGWHRREPGDQIEPQEPTRMKRLVMRALAEDLISPSRAAELLGLPLQEFIQRESQRHGGIALGLRA